MRYPLAASPNVVLIVVEYLRGVLSVPVYSRVPDSRPESFVRVKRVGGSRTTPVATRPRFSVECWAATEWDAETLAHTAEAHCLALSGPVGSTTAYRPKEVSGPLWIPDETTGTPRYSFAFEASFRLEAG